jgi:hypothetical protein
MISRQSSVISLALALTVTSAVAQERPAVGPERPFQLAPRIEKTLPNGLRVIVTRQTAVPKVSITLTVLSGYSSDPADLTGLASLTADLIQEGTKTKNSRQIRRDAFGMGGGISAAASQDYTTVSARGLAEYAPRLIDLVADVVMNPTFPEDELAILKQQHLQGVQQQKASPQALANRMFRQMLFGDHPYARTGETEASLKLLDRAKVVAFHAAHYRPNHAFLLIVGAVDPEATIAAVGKTFGGWTRADVPKPGFTAAPALAGRHLYFVQRPNSVQSSIALGNVAVKRSEGDFHMLHDGAFVWARHLAPIGQTSRDFVAEAERHIGAAYLWGGRTTDGLDCSALVQNSMELAGLKAPRDSDMQARDLGTPLNVAPDLSGMRRGDLLFWTGHVGVMRDATELLHASGRQMEVVSEPLGGAAARIEHMGGGAIAGARRLPKLCG